MRTALRYKYNHLVSIIVFSIPLTILADWLFEFEITNLQAGLYLKGVSVFLFLYILISLKNKEFFFKNVLIYFLGLFLVYSLFSNTIITNLYFSIRIAYWILGTLVFYSFFRYKIISNEQLKQMLMLTVIIASTFTFMRVSQLEEGDYNTASAYLLLWCVPLLAIFKKDQRVQIILAICVIGIIITIKRGAIIALLLSFVAYYIANLSYSRNNSAGNKNTFIQGVLLLIIIAVAIYSRWDIIDNRLQDTGASGRDVMYEGIITSYFNSNFGDFIFGHGINSVQEFTAIYLANDKSSVGVAAHSEWLQYAYDFGILGILFLIFLHIKQIQILLFFYRVKSSLFPGFLMFYVIFSLTTIYSFILNTPKAIFFGISLAFFSYQRNRIINKRRLLAKEIKLIRQQKLQHQNGI